MQELTIALHALVNGNRVRCPAVVTTDSGGTEMGPGAPASCGWRGGCGGGGSGCFLVWAPESGSGRNRLACAMVTVGTADSGAGGGGGGRFPRAAGGNGIRGDHGGAMDVALPWFFLWRRPWCWGQWMGQNMPGPQTAEWGRPRSHPNLPNPT